jgi:dTDP-4-amino-4,6-dideoxy-D-galactose acyltransferase
MSNVSPPESAPESSARPDPCEMLAWDSEFFGVRVARLRGDVLRDERRAVVDEWCVRNGVSCLYFQCRPDDPGSAAAAEGGGFRLVDVRMTFARDASPAAEADPVVRNATAADVPVLRRIARESHRDTRFYLDHHFPRHLCDLLYERWIQSSCEGHADAVLVAGDEGVPTGYVTCHLDRPGPGAPAGAAPLSGRIGLLGVDAAARGGGLGARLTRAAVNWLVAKGAGGVSVVTQGRNVAAQRLYQRCGFLTRDVHLYFHKWYTAPRP